MKFKGLFLVPALAVLIWGSWVLQAPNALCGPEDEAGGRAGGDAPKKKTKQGTIQRAFRMDEIEIHGDVEKPKTMFVIPRASLRYSRKDQEKDFTGEILGPVTKEWVEDTQRWRFDIPQP